MILFIAYEADSLLNTCTPDLDIAVDNDPDIASQKLKSQLPAIKN
jgi:hypothetical protein